MATPIPQNRASFAIDDIAKATGGEVVRGGGPSVGVCTDTRAITESCAFVAIAGDRFDAHSFLADAVGLGAKTLVVSHALDAALATQAAVIRVADTRFALGNLALFHRERWAMTAHVEGKRALIAITGSAGKTTTAKKPVGKMTGKKTDAKKPAAAKKPAGAKKPVAAKKPAAAKKAPSAKTPAKKKK